MIQTFINTKFGGPYGTEQVISTGTIGTTTHSICPQFVKLASGRLLAVFTVYSGAVEFSSSIVYSSYSDNGGATWSAQAAVSGAGADTQNDGSLFLLSNGNIVVTYYTHAVAANGNDPNAAQTHACYRISTDSGSTWGNEVYMGDFYGDGSYYTPYQNGWNYGDVLYQPCYRQTGGPSETFLAKSTDGGVTWSKLAGVVGASPIGANPWYNETGMAQKPGTSTIIGMIREEISGKYYRIVSTDMGVSWSAPAQINIIIGGFPILAYDGNLLFFCEKGFGGFFQYSWDDGLTWHISTNYIDGSKIPSQYSTSGVLVTADGRHMVMYDKTSTLNFVSRATGDFA